MHVCSFRGRVRLDPVTRLVETVVTSLICPDQSSSTVAVRMRGSGRLARSSAHNLRGVETVVAVTWAGAAARGAGTVVVIGRARVPATSADGHWQTLRNLSRALTGIPAVVDGEVAANHVGTSGSRIFGELIRFVVDVSGVLAVVHSDCGAIAVTGLVRLE